MARVKANILDLMVDMVINLGLMVGMVIRQGLMADRVIGRLGLMADLQG